MTKTKQKPKSKTAAPPTPRQCPYCGSTDLHAGPVWRARSTEEADTRHDLEELQCHAPGCCRSFWV